MSSTVVTRSTKRREEEEKKKDALAERKEEDITPNKKRRGCPKKNQRLKPVNRGAESGVDIQTSDSNPVEAKSVDTPWLCDSQLNPKKVREAQRKDPAIDRFIVLKVTSLVGMMWLPKGTS